MGLKNKKGIFFTLVAIALLSLAMVSFSIYSVVQDRMVVTKRVSSMNSFVFSLEEDLERKLYISGFRIIFLFEKRIIENGAYITDAETTINESFFNGTIEGEIKGDEIALMQGVTFEEIKTDLEKSAKKANLNLGLDKPVLRVYHNDPWNVRLELRTNFSVIGTAGLASWNKTLVTTADIPIGGFEDPLYLIGTSGRIFQIINQSPYTNFVSGGDVTNLSDHSEKSYYIESDMAPSFLNRLEGNFSASENGIESLVYIPELSNQDLNIKDKSVVDYIYFGTVDPATQLVTGMPTWFKLDAAHYDKYNVTGIVI